MLACTLGLGAFVLRLEAGELELRFYVAPQRIGDRQVPAQRRQRCLQVVVARCLAACLREPPETGLQPDESVPGPIEDIEVPRQPLGRTELLGDDLLRRLAPLVSVPLEQPGDGGVTDDDAVRFGEPRGDLTTALPLARQPQDVRNESVGDASLALSIGHRVAVRRAV